MAASWQYFYLQKSCMLEIRVVLLKGCAVSVCMFTHLRIHFLFIHTGSKDALFPGSVSNPFPYVSFHLRWFEAFACCSPGFRADGNRRLLNEAFFFPLTVLISIPLTDI